MLIIEYYSREFYVSGIKSMHRLQMVKLNGISVSNISSMVPIEGILKPKALYVGYNYINGSIGSYDKPKKM